MKTFYSDYVWHCMRFYARHAHPNFRSDVDKKNWYACDSAMGDFTDRERDILTTIYRDGDSVYDSVYKAAGSFQIAQDTIWKVIHELEHKVAKRRGLI